MMIKAEEAEKIILDNVSELETIQETIPHVLRMILAEDIYAGIDIPSVASSAMDGYAVRSEDIHEATQESPVTLQVIDRIFAGAGTLPTITPKTAAKIMTGASMPDGADSVVMVEYTKETDSSVQIFQKTKSGENVRTKGEDVSCGELVIKKGTRLNPSHIAMLAALGREKVEVIRCPTVSIISTGDELVDISAELTFGKKRDSNSYALEAQLMEISALPHRLGIVPDDRNKIKEAFLKAVDSDVVITSAGVSVGDCDLVVEVIKEIGAEIKFDKLAIKPGKPFTFALYDKKPIFALPGNPVSVMVCFEIFIKPALLKMMGDKEIGHHKIKAILTEDIKKKAGRKNFLRAELKMIDGHNYVSLTGPQGSGILKSMVLANALVIIPEDVVELKKGEEVAVYPLWYR